MKVYGVVAAIGCMAIACAGAEDDAYAGYVRLNGEDTAANQSWNKKGHWAEAPTSGKGFYVPAGAFLWQQSGNGTADADRTWKGGQLVVGGTFLSTVNNDQKYGPYIEDLVLLGGSECRVGCFTFLAPLNGVTGTVTVAGTAADPAVIAHHHVNSSNGSRAYPLQGLFTGTADSVLVLTRPYVNYEGKDMDYGWTCHLNPIAFASYPGTLVLRGGNFKASPNSRTSTFNMPLATLRVEQGANCQFHFNSATAAIPDAHIGALESVGGKLYFNSLVQNGALTLNPVVNVTERLALDAATSVVVPTNVTSFLAGVTPDNPLGATCRIAHLTGAAAETLGDISAVKVAATDNDQYGYPVRLCAVDGPDGTKDIYLATPDVVVMTNRNVESGAGRYGAFEEGHAGDWTNLETPPEDSSLHYLALQRLCFHEDTERTNATLSLAASSSCLSGTRLSFREINLCKGGALGLWGSSDPNRTVKADRLNVISTNGNSIFVSSGTSVTVDADVCGGGNLTLRNNNDGYGGITVNHLNTNFHGRLTITQGGSNTTGDVSPQRLNVYLYDALNFGGAYTASDNGWNAITISRSPVVIARSDANFSEPTRGVLLQGGPVLSVVANATMRFATQVTFAGRVTKYGYGTLDLAGTARFIDGRADTPPVAGTNVLNVTGGKLRISSKTAADGLAITFSEGTRLVIPADTEAGYCNTKWDAPLSIETADGKLPVEIDPEGVEGGVNVAVPVCTFSATAAESIPATAFSVTMDKPGMRLKSFSKRTNGDGTVSYVAVFGPVGCRVILR